MSDFEISRLLLSLAFLLSSALALGQLFHGFRLPRVIGEICAGLVLGPSLLGQHAPYVHQWIFRAFDDQAKLLSMFYWWGLILLMFSAGFKVSTTFAKKDHSLVPKLIVGGVGLPFIFGFAGSSWLPNRLGPDPLAFSLVVATAAAVTSIPVLTKIFLDLGIGSGRFARLTLAAAAVQDLLIWAVLSMAIAIQQGQIVHPSDLLITILTTLAFSAFSILIASRLVRLSGRMLLGRSPHDALHGYTLLVCLVLVSVAGLLKVNIVFGAILAGIVIGRVMAPQMEAVRCAITNVSAWFFVPIYFALVGMQIDLRANLDVDLLLGFWVVSSIIKVASVVLFTGKTAGSWSRALDFGIVMNARGGPGIVLASLAYATRIIDQYLFTALIITSILTSLTAGIWLRMRLHMHPEQFE